MPKLWLGGQALVLKAILLQILHSMHKANSTWDHLEPSWNQSGPFWAILRPLSLLPPNRRGAPYPSPKWSKWGHFEHKTKMFQEGYQKRKTRLRLARKSRTLNLRASGPGKCCTLATKLKKKRRLSGEVPGLEFRYRTLYLVECTFGLSTWVRDLAVWIFSTHFEAYFRRNRQR